MIRGVWRFLLATVTMTALFTVHPLSSGSAAAAPEKKCVFIAEKAKPGTEATPLREVCGDETTVASAAAERTLLMTLYEHADFGGDSSDIYGDYGTCDPQGYTFDFSARYWGWVLSSYRVHGRCWLSNLDTRSPGMNYGPTRAGPVTYVGDAYNDNVGFLWIRAQAI